MHYGLCENGDCKLAIQPKNIKLIYSRTPLNVHPPNTNICGFSSRLGAEVVCAAINLERTGNLSSKVGSCGYNLVVT